MNKLRIAQVEKDISLLEAELELLKNPVFRKAHVGDVYLAFGDEVRLIVRRKGNVVAVTPTGGRGCESPDSCIQAGSYRFQFNVFD